MAAAERRTEDARSKPIFCELSASDLEPEITEIESLCVECGKNVSKLRCFCIRKYFSLRQNSLRLTDISHLQGDYPAAVDENPTLQGRGAYVLRVRALRLSE